MRTRGDIEYSLRMFPISTRVRSLSRLLAKTQWSAATAVLSNCSTYDSIEHVCYVSSAAVAYDFRRHETRTRHHVTFNFVPRRRPIWRLADSKDRSASRRVTIALARQRACARTTSLNYIMRSDGSRSTTSFIVNVLTALLLWCTNATICDR